MAKILVIGSINQDIVAKVNRLPKEGETVLSTEGKYYFGGKGANQAIACAKLGGECSFIGMVGDDSYGQSYLENLQSYRINTEGVMVTKKTGTGIALITVDEQANNSIVVLQNANNVITYADIIKYKKHFMECDYVLLQLEIPINVIEQVISYAYTLNKKVILNPAPYNTIKADILKKVHILTPNETEAYQLIGENKPEIFNSFINKVEDLIRVGKNIKSIGIEHLIITIGKDGVLYFNNDNINHFSGFNVNALDTTGAGDTFNGSLVYFLSQGYSFPEAIIRSQASAALCIKEFGAQTSMPSIATVKEFLIDNKPSVRILI